MALFDQSHYRIDIPGKVTEIIDMHSARAFAVLAVAVTAQVSGVDHPAMCGKVPGSGCVPPAVFGETVDNYDGA